MDVQHEKHDACEDSFQDCGLFEHIPLTSAPWMTFLWLAEVYSYCEGGGLPSNTTVADELISLDLQGFGYFS